MKMKFSILAVLLLFLNEKGLAQQYRILEAPFKADNGFHGIALLETGYFMEGTYKLKVSLLQLQITGYKTSIGFFEKNDLERSGFTFPFYCNDCAFQFSGTVGMVASDLNDSIQVPIKTQNPIALTSHITLSIPFTGDEEGTITNEALKDWEGSGYLELQKATNLEGASLKAINTAVKQRAKAAMDAKRLARLTEELQGRDKTAQLQHLYHNRSGFYNKEAVDSLILALKYGNAVVATDSGAEENSSPNTPVQENAIVVTNGSESGPDNASAPAFDQEVHTPDHDSAALVPSEDYGEAPDSAFSQTDLSVPLGNGTTTLHETEKKTAVHGSFMDSSQDVLTLESKRVKRKKESGTLMALASVPPKQKRKSTSLLQSSESPTHQLGTLTEVDPTALVETTNKSNGETMNSSVVKTSEKNQRKKTQRLSKMTMGDFDFSCDPTKYKRSSLHTLMLKNPDTEHAELIAETFMNRPLPEKFNTHTINTHFISVDRKARKQEKTISAFLKRQQIAKELVAKWFNRNEKGEFNMDLVAERGHYNASVYDLNIARKSERGLAMLADAGEQLIANTFLIVNDYKYTNKEEVAKKTGFFSSVVSFAASAAGASDLALIADATTVATGVAGKGYVVKVTSYLYRLKWNEAIANTFYEHYWVDKGNFDSKKKRAFDDTDLFEMEFLGYETDFSATQSTVFTSKSNAELIERSTIKATEQTIAKLQRKFQVFRTVSPLVSTEPLAAKIGMKEGLEKGDRFEVLEQFLKQDGTIGLNRIGVIKVDKNRIWDNRYRTDQEQASGNMDMTTFIGPRNKFYEGMLIRQIN